MITFEEYAPKEIEDEYPDIFHEVFNEYPGAHSPGSIVLIYSNGVYIGFLSYYTHDLDTVYVQYAGLIKRARNKNALKIFKSLFSRLHTVYKAIMVAIENTNSKALKICIACGFVVTGIRMSVNKNLFVEMLKIREA